MDQGLFCILSGFAFALGASIASFLNVVIWRCPRGESLVSPPSHCPKCNAPIRWYQNIPLVSWLALRGRCAVCREPISPRYFFVELLGGVLFLAVFREFAGSLSAAEIVQLAVLLVWTSLMIVGTFIDFDHQLLPDFVTVGGMIIGLLFAVFCGYEHFGFASWTSFTWRPLAVSAIGLAVGFGLLGLIRAVGSMVFRREAMGMGDVFLLGAVGALFGPVAALFTIVFSAFIGAVAGIGLMIFQRIRPGRFVAIPYGPYICMACLLWMFRGQEIVDWYLSMFRT